MKKTLIIVSALVLSAMLSGCDVVSDALSGPGKSGPVLDALALLPEPSKQDDELSPEDIPGLITEDPDAPEEESADNTAESIAEIATENAEEIAAENADDLFPWTDAGSAGTGESHAAAETVTVSGKCTMYSTPDKAEINIGVHTREADAATAQQANTEIVDNVIQAIKELGTDEKSIRTTGYNIWQEYNYETGEVRGYNVTTSLTIKDLDIADAGAVITQAIAAGANEMNGISYSCSDYDKVYREALAAAVDAAREKGVVLAEAAGKELGDVQTVLEGYQDMNARYSRSNVTMDAAAEEKSLGAAAASVMPGEAEINAEVTVTYYMK